MHPGTLVVFQVVEEFRRTCQALSEKLGNNRFFINDRQVINVTIQEFKWRMERFFFFSFYSPTRSCILGKEILLPEFTSCGCFLKMLAGLFSYREQHFYLSELTATLALLSSYHKNLS